MLIEIISCGGEVVGAFVGCEGVEDIGDGDPKIVDRAGSGLAEQSLELCEGHFD